MRLPFRKKGERAEPVRLIPELPRRYRVAAAVGISCAAIAATAAGSGMNEPNDVLAAVKFAAAAVIVVAPFYLAYRRRHSWLPKPNPGYQPASREPRLRLGRQAPEPAVAVPAETHSAPTSRPGAARPPR